MRIEEAAARKQAKIDSGEEFIIGVNSFKSNQKQPEFEILDIDNTDCFGSFLFFVFVVHFYFWNMKDISMDRYPIGRRSVNHKSRQN